MNLRTITIGVPLGIKTDPDKLKIKIQKFLEDMKIECARKEIFIRTLRINLTPVSEDNKGEINKQSIIGKINSISKLCDELNINWFNVPFDLTKTNKKEH